MPHQIERLTDTEARKFVDHLLERFGFPADMFRDLAFFRRGRRYLYAAHRDTDDVVGHGALESIGLPVLRLQHAALKLSTHGACLWGRHAARNVIELDHVQMTAYLRRISTPIEERQAENCSASGGQVIVRWNGYPVGIGWLRMTVSGLQVESLYPQAEAPTSDQDPFAAGR